MATQPDPEILIEYKTRIIPALREKHGYTNLLQIPRVTKVVVNSCVGADSDSKEALEVARQEIGLITGQRPITTHSKKSIANFKLREGQAIGAKVTLRGRTMYEFLERLIRMSLPRIRDFRGVSAKAFDGNGNYSLGLSEQMVFPEINPDRYSRPQGMNITFVTSAESDEDAREFLLAMGLPLKKEGEGDAAA